MLEFPLEDWEWPKRQSHTFTVEPFECEVRWPDGLRKTLIGAVPWMSKDCECAMVFFRPLEVAADSPYPLNNYVHMWDLSDMDDPPIIAHLSPKDSHREREFYTAPNFVLDPYRIFHLRNHTAILQGRHGRWNKKFNVIPRFQLPFDSTHRTGKELRAWLRAQLRDESSEAIFASTWLGKSGQEKLAHIERLVPQLRELKRILKLIAQAENDLSEELKWYPQLGVSISRFASRLAYRQHKNPYTSPPQSKRLKFWRRILKRAFPLYPLESPEVPLCVSDTYLNYHLYYLSVPGTDATGHERMEAIASLRDWAQHHASPREMKVLF